jgi:hypothetical protein
MKIAITINDNVFEADGFIATEVLEEVLRQADILETDENVFFLNRNQQSVLDKAF